MSNAVEREKQQLGISEWHKTGLKKTDRPGVYVDLYPTRDEYSPTNQEVLLATVGISGPTVFVDMTADDAEMLGMRLIAAARMYREQDKEA